MHAWGAMTFFKIIKPFENLEKICQRLILKKIRGHPSNPCLRQAGVQSAFY